MGETSGGAPYGLSVDEYRQYNEQVDADAGWARAKQALGRALARISPGEVDVEVGFVEAIGRGGSREAFGAHVEVTPDLDRRSGSYIALLVDPDADATSRRRITREAELLEHLEAAPCALRTPRGAVLVGDRLGPILVESFVAGVVVDPRAGRMPGVRPWEIFARVAAELHAVSPPPTWPHRTRRSHRASIVARLEQMQATHPFAPTVLVDATLTWLRAHVDDPRPGTLLHGELLGHNLRWVPNEPVGVIDWREAHVGDPAYDLAVATGGSRRPFQLADGRERLLETYNVLAREPVDVSALQFFELALATRGYLRASSDHEVALYTHKLLRLLELPESHRLQP
jgi:aminoglycoside phosphotransferase (APT) family kinase protein